MNLFPYKFILKSRKSVKIKIEKRDVALKAKEVTKM